MLSNSACLISISLYKSVCKKEFNQGPQEKKWEKTGQLAVIGCTHLACQANIKSLSASANMSEKFVI